MLPSLKSVYKNINSSRILFAVLTAIFLAASIPPYYKLFSVPHNPRDTQLLMQCLDLEWMKKAFWECVIYNHYQPPLFFNFFLGGVYKISPGLIHPLFYSLSLGLSLLSLWALIWLCERLNLSRWITLIVGLSYIFQPSRIELEHFVFYTAPCLFSLTFSLYFFRRFMDRNRTIDFLFFSIFSAALTLMNSSFHYVWAIGAILFALFLAPARNMQLKITAAAVCLLVLVVPLKNFFVFGFLGSSSCAGFVLADRINVPQDIKEAHLSKGEVSTVFVENGRDCRILPYKQFPIPEKFKNIQSLTQPVKDYAPPGVRTWSPQRVINYNHYSSLEANKLLIKDSLWLVKKYPSYYWEVTKYQVGKFFSLEGKGETLVSLWMKIQGWVFLLCFPLGAIFFLSRIKQTLQDPSQKLILILLYHLAYSLFIGILICCGDGERYRYPFETCYLLMAGFLLNELWVKLLRRG